MTGRKLIFSSIPLLLLICCAKKENETRNLLAKIGDRTITVSDFRERAELTPRPLYCDGNSDTDKSIILNTLIAEKLLALEGAKDSLLINNNSIKNYVLGRKEQMMRRQLLNMELAEQLQVPVQEQLDVLKQATKKIHVSYLYSDRKQEIESWTKEIDRTKDFEQAEKIINAGKPPHLKEIIWGENLEAIENELFTDSVTVASIVGPVETKAGYYIFKVNEITREVILTQESLDNKLLGIKNVLAGRKWNNASANYVYQMMKDKDIRLDPSGFQLILQYYRPIFAVPDTREEFIQRDHSEVEKIAQKFQHTLMNNLDVILLTVDGEPWSVGEFIEYSRHRPLIFRAKRMLESEFPHHLKLAVKDLLVDKYLTDRAYKSELDQNPQVIREERQWQDNMLALGKRNMLLNELGFDGDLNEDYIQIINLLQPQLKKMARNYNIELQAEKFENIPLTRVQFMAVQEGLPYIQAVPAFPVLTNNNQHDYFTRGDKLPGNISDSK